MEIVLGLFAVAIAGVIGGISAKLLKLPALVGYIIVGIIVGAILPVSIKSISSLAEIGTILLLFSIGVELSLTKLTRFFNVAVFGSILQMVLTTLIFYLLLVPFGFGKLTAIIFALGFSVSSTAVLVKILDAKGEMDTVHGQILFGWSLVQDLLVVPIMVILPIVVGTGGNALGPLVMALIKSGGVILVTVFLGKIVIPPLIHKIAEANSRELLLLSAIALALGTAGLTSFLGISPALGAFLAGLVISDLGEHGAIFSEIRPLRDLFVALFFVSLGFIVSPHVLFENLGAIALIAILVIAVKMIVTFILSSLFGYRGKTGMAVSFGLAQVGEFAFVIFSGAAVLGYINSVDTSIGVAITLLTLTLSPILYSKVFDLWRKLKRFKIFASTEPKQIQEELLHEHIIICGYGRVGKWVGRALNDFKVPFVVIDYDQEVVQNLKNTGTTVLYGDPTEPEVLEAANVREARAIVLAIPDRIAQETLIAYVQTVAPNAKIISRVHQDSDLEKFRAMKVDKLIQPEFEAAVEIVRSILSARGKEKDEISEAVTSLRLSHSK